MVQNSNNKLWNFITDVHDNKTFVAQFFVRRISCRATGLAISPVTNGHYQSSEYCWIDEHAIKLVECSNIPYNIVSFVLLSYSVDQIFRVKVIISIDYRYIRPRQHPDLPGRLIFLISGSGCTPPLDRNVEVRCVRSPCVSKLIL